MQAVLSYGSEATRVVYMLELCLFSVLLAMGWL